ncbi:alpha/beta fold hydrolase [Chloropicon primus]|uniref:Alpha/beta fold hydrolase n=2 Tax=Chloropicon primus TaxID=1764295 RepID=A0A5B8MRH0_9CHLO|nr:alpha/beta fold hydrolase [Chloropicon primus]UPR01230.1 alpha/beta fold hydrolase [Chloropicon primus]|eukprot:QDZ22010.1 alpha/beta fold hydrolase [Chloropicon primus]
MVASPAVSRRMAGGGECSLQVACGRGDGGARRLGRRRGGRARRGRAGRTVPAVSSPLSSFLESSSSGGRRRTGWAPGLTDLPSKESLREYIKGSGGPPRVFSPLPPNHRDRKPEDLPLLIVLPGIDGTGYTAAAQFPALSERFDLKTFLIPVDDRTPLDGLVQILREYIELEVARSAEDRPIYIMGESFGGMLALLLAESCGHLCLNRVVLVNPATSFGNSIWASMGDVLPQLPPQAYDALPFAISPLLGNPLGLARRRVDEDQPLASQAVQTIESLFDLLPVLDQLKDILPPQTLKWKLDLLQEGAKRVDDALLSRLEQRVLVIAGDADLLIPSKDESERLKRNLRTCSVKVVEGAGHALLQEAGVDVNDIFDEMGFYTTSLKYTSPKPVKRVIKSNGHGGHGLENGAKKKDIMLSIDNAKSMELPTLGELSKVCDDIGLTRAKTLVSPVFFSTSSDNEVVRGLEHLPKGRPLIIVSNHQTLALDLGFLISGLLEEGGILARGLAHPSLFQEESTTNAGMRGIFTNFGAVPVTPRNMFKLLKNEEVVLLFPGGASEALKGKGEDYQLFWPEEQEFVRIAARFNATIVTLSGVGIDDSLDILASSKEILDFPVVGDFFKRSIENVKTVREGETLVFPLTAPRAINRLYFKFGQPIHVSKDMMNDKDRCEEVYHEAKRRLEDGLMYLQKNRERDPYRDLIPRVLYERNTGEKAPTFID